MEHTESNTPETTRRGLWNFIDNIKGDKVIWIIVLLLLIFSVLTIFSSTSTLSDESRVEIMKEHAWIAIIGLGVIVALQGIKKIGWFRIISQLGFAATFALLTILVFDIDLGFMSPVTLNGARRTILAFGLQIHVYEFAKVAMVMYLAWALHAYKHDTFAIANALAQKKGFEFMGKAFWKRAFYIYAPTLITCAMIAAGSNSSAIFTFMILVVVMLMGGVPFKDMLLTGAVVAVMCGAAYGLHKATDGEFMPRIKTLLSRVGADYDTKVLEGLRPGSDEFYNALDKIRQPYGAKVAIHEGQGIIMGKGVGNSTQKYSVTHIYSDYMYSFIIEEYGLLGAIIILILYTSLLARCSMIIRMCENEFAKIAIGGLAFLITGQAYLHMLVNVQIIPMTGQTLPMLSDGAFAFLTFCVAFGIILSISKMARTKMKAIEEVEVPIKDDIQSTLEIIEQIDDDIQ
ncbi:MAG: hypothetical protein E7112_06850 [Bacteroidales bacterium]|nr:hypothetical protein [Bacteroidales bacterium]